MYEDAKKNVEGTEWLRRVDWNAANKAAQDKNTP